MEIAHDHVGDGPPLVLLHPLGADRHVWDPVVPRLAQRRTVIAMDLPGFGQSPPLSGVAPTPRALADAITQAVGRLGLQRPHVAGNSLGGWVALELGLSGEATSVAAIAPAGLWPAPLVPKPSLGHWLARALLPLARAMVRSAAGRRTLLGGSMAHPERVDAGDAVHLVTAYAHAPGFVAVNRAMRAGRFPSLAEIRCPVTLGWPDGDRLVARPATLPVDIESVVLRDAGHIPMWDAPDAVADLLLRASGAEGSPAAARLRSGG